MRRMLWNLVPGLLLVVSACGGGSGGPEEPKPVDRPVRVEVVNNHALPIEVFALGSGINQRLGTVHPGMGARFTIPQAMLGGSGVELQARPGANEQPFTSDPLLLAPGTIVDFKITPQLFNSTVSLRE